MGNRTPANLPHEKEERMSQGGARSGVWVTRMNYSRLLRESRQYMMDELRFHVTPPTQSLFPGLGAKVEFLPYPVSGKRQPGRAKNSCLSLIKDGSLAPHCFRKKRTNPLVLGGNKANLTKMAWNQREMLPRIIWKSSLTQPDPLPISWTINLALSHLYFSRLSFLGYKTEVVTAQNP